MSSSSVDSAVSSEAEAIGLNVMSELHDQRDSLKRTKANPRPEAVRSRPKPFAGSLERRGRPPGHLEDVSESNVQTSAGKPGVGGGGGAMANLAGRATVDLQEMFFGHEANV